MQPGNPRWSFLLFFLIAVALCSGGGFVISKHSDASWSIDSESYLRMAQGDFNVTVTHRYRVIVPLMAGTFHTYALAAMHVVWPEKSEVQLLRYSFFVVNLLLFALAVALLASTYAHSGESMWLGVLVALPLCASRWAVYLIGLPLTDSLYLACLACLWVGLITSNTRMLWAALIVGPMSKETFILFLPLLLAAPALSKKVLRSAFLAGLIGVLGMFSIRWWIDTQFGAPPENTTDNILLHVQLAGTHTLQLLSIKGIAQVFGTFGLFGLLPLVVFLPAFASFRVTIYKSLKPLWLLIAGWLGVVVIHMVLSGDFSRMFFFASPPLVWGLGHILRPYLLYVKTS